MGQINQAIQEYNDTGFITLTKWDSTNKKVIIPHQVIPIPSDWMQSLKIDHSTYTGDSTIYPSNPDLWEFLKSETDNAHLYYAEPLDSSTLSKLGFTRFPTSVESKKQIPMEFILYQNYPNPFNPGTKIQYAISSTQFVQLKIYDFLGREVTTLVSEEKVAGSYEINFDASQLTSGIYFYRLQAGDFIQTKKMILIK
ncbi:MAG: T9SS type A sorting domain-containing protein [Ignavibacteriales bacterium]|nr:T9SS type A sorting domain-containing protein [Ignavibacteriales bacterium]